MRYWFLFIVLLVLSACKKDTINLEFAQIETGVNQRITNIYFVNENLGFACGGLPFANGFILKTTNGGSTWQLNNNLIGHGLNSIRFVNDSVGYAVGYNGYILRTENAGNSWSVHNYFTYEVLNDIHLFSETEGLAVGGQYYSKGLIAPLINWNNFDWGRDTLDKNLTSLCFVNSTTGFATGYGIINKTNNAGITWQTANIDNDFFIDVDFPSDYTGYVCGFQGGVYKTENQGENWQTINKPNKALSKREHFNSIHFANNYIGATVGMNGLMLFTENGGEQLSYVNTPTSTNLRAVYLLNNNTGFIGGDNGELWKFIF